MVFHSPLILPTEECVQIFKFFIVHIYIVLRSVYKPSQSFIVHIYILIRVFTKLNNLSYFTNVLLNYWIMFEVAIYNKNSLKRCWNVLGKCKHLTTIWRIHMNYEGDKDTSQGSSAVIGFGMAYSWCVLQLKNSQMR